MKNVTVRLSEEQVETLDKEADDLDLSRAEYIRDLIMKGRESDEIRRELEETQNKVIDLRQQLQAVNARQEDVGELVEYVERERELDQRREQRRQAPAWRRAKWRLLGAPAADQGTGERDS